MRTSDREGLLRFSRSPRLSQPHPESGAAPEKPLPSIQEYSEDPENFFQPSPATITRRKLLLPNLNSPVRRGSLSSLLGDDLRQFSALRRNCRSPARYSQGRSPSPRCRREERLSDSESSSSWKPGKLLIPSLVNYGPPNLSPRVVDGIEDDGRASESQTFSFNMDQPPQSSVQEHPVSGPGLANSVLAAESEEIKQSIRKLNQEISNLNQEVSHLSQELQLLMGLLQNQLTALSSSSSAASIPASACPHNSAQTSPSLPPVSRQPVHQPSSQALVSVLAPSPPASLSTDFSAFSTSLPSVASPCTEHLGSQERLGCTSCDPASPSHRYHWPRMDTGQGSHCGQTANLTSSHSSSPILCPVTSLSPRTSVSSCSGQGCPPTRFQFRSNSDTFR